MSMSKLKLQVLIDDELVYTIENPQSKPAVGDYIEIPKIRFGITEMVQLYVGRVLNKYPTPSRMDQSTIIQCECVAVPA